jgi:hypothetical protein
VQEGGSPEARRILDPQRLARGERQVGDPDRMAVGEGSLQVDQVTEGPGHVVEGLRPHGRPRLGLGLQDGRHGVLLRQVRQQRGRQPSQPLAHPRIKGGSGPAPERGHGRIGASQVGEQRRGGRSVGHPDGHRQVLARQSAGRALAVPRLERLVQGLLDPRGEPQPPRRDPGRLAVGGVVRHPEPLAPQERDRRHADPVEAPAGELRHEGPEDVSQVEEVRLRSCRVEGDVVAPEQRRLVRVADASEVLEEGRVVDVGALLLRQVEILGQLHGDAAGSHGLFGRVSHAEIRDDRQTGEHVGQPEHAAPLLRLGRAAPGPAR